MIAAVAAVGCASEATSPGADGPARSAPTTTAATGEATTTVPTVAPAPTTAVAPTSPATSAPPPSVAPTTPATSAPTTSVPTPVDGVVLIAAGGAASFPWLPLGWWDGAGWDEWDILDDALPPLPDPSVDAVVVASVALDAPVTGLSFGEYDIACETGWPGEVGPTVSLDVDVPSIGLGWGYDAIAVTADWNVQPREVAAVGLAADVYQEVGESLLSLAPGVDPAAGDVVQVFRVDLDGNGTEEVLVTFEHQTGSPFGELGEFTLVYARVIGADGVVDIPLFEYLVPDPDQADPPYPAPGRAAIAAIADVNGDGVMEVAVASRWWEGVGMQLLEFDGAAFTSALTGGCGA